MQRRQQQVAAGPSSLATMGRPTLNGDVSIASGPAARGPDLRVQDSVDGRPLRGGSERPDDV